MEITGDDKLNLPVLFTVQPEFTSDRFLKVRLQICHDGKNKNQSYFPTDAFDKAASRLSYTPILAYTQVEDGEGEFGGHAVHLEANQMGDGLRRYYDEVPIGVIPENCNYALEEANGKTYVCADAYVWREYSNYAEDIIERDQQIPVSMEITVLDYTFNKGTNVCNITDYRYKGVSCCNDPDTVAMEGANLRVAEQYQKVTADEVLSLMAQALREELSQYTTEGANNLEDNVTLNDGVETTVTEPEVPAEAENVSTENTDEGVETPAQEEQSSETNESAPESEGSESESTDSLVETDYSLQSNIMTSISEALSEYKTDIDGYSCPKYFLEDVDMSASRAYVFNIDDGRIYASDFTVDGDKVSLDGTFRRQVVEYRDYSDTPKAAVPTAASEFTRKLAQEVAGVQGAKKELDDLRSFKEQYETEQRKNKVEAVLDQFSDLSKNAEFKTLKENLDKYTVEEIETQCYAIRGKSVTPDTTFTTNTKPGLRATVNPSASDSTPKSGMVAILEKFFSK